MSHLMESGHERRAEDCSNPENIPRRHGYSEPEKQFKVDLGELGQRKRSLKRARTSSSVAEDKTERDVLTSNKEGMVIKQQDHLINGERKSAEVMGEPITAGVSTEDYTASLQHPIASGTQTGVHSENPGKASTLKRFMSSNPFLREDVTRRQGEIDFGEPGEQRRSFRPARTGEGTIGKDVLTNEVERETKKRQAPKVMKKPKKVLELHRRSFTQGVAISTQPGTDLRVEEGSLISWKGMNFDELLIAQQEVSTPVAKPRGTMTAQLTSAAAKPRMARSLPRSIHASIFQATSPVEKCVDPTGISSGAGFTAINAQTCFTAEQPAAVVKTPTQSSPHAISTAVQPIIQPTSGITPSSASLEASAAAAKATNAITPPSDAGPTHGSTVGQPVVKPTNAMPSDTKYTPHPNSTIKPTKVLMSSEAASLSLAKDPTRSTEVANSSTFELPSEVNSQVGSAAYQPIAELKTPLPVDQNSGVVKLPAQDGIDKEPPDAQFRKLEVQERSSRAQLLRLEAEIEELREELQIQARAIKAQDEKIRAKAGEVAAKKEEITAKEEKIKAKNDAISAKDCVIKFKDAKLQAKAVEVGVKEEEIVAKYDAIRTMDAVIKEKDAKLQTKAGEISAKEEEIAAKEEEIEAKNNEINTKDKVIEDKEAKIQAQAIKIGAMEVDIESKNDELTAKNAEISTKTSAIKAKDVEIQAKTIEIAALEIEIKAKKGEIGAKDDIIKQRDVQLQARAREVVAIEAMNDEMREKDDTIKTKDAEIQAKAREIAANKEMKNREIRTMASKILTQEDIIAAKEVDIQRKDKQITDLQKLVEDLKTEQSSLPSADKQSWRIPRAQIFSQREIGRGAWGAVYSGTFRGEQVAIKKAHRAILDIEGTINMLKREVVIMADVQHPNLVRFIGAVFDDAVDCGTDAPIVVSELMDMNLREAYKKLDISKSLTPIFIDVAYALHYLHQLRQPIIHRDVSAPNVLLKTMPKGVYEAKVSDFGSANHAKQAHTAGAGAIIYCAPEMFPSDDITAPPRPQTTKVDVFSYGILMLEVISKEMPSTKKRYNMLQKVSPQWKELIVKCTQPLPDNRPTMADILNKLHQLPHPKGV